MKIKRYKKVNRHLNFYVNNFNFRQPYQLLIDGTFCYAALNNQVNIAENLSPYLHGELKLLTTPCAIIEMENLGPKLNGALLILKQFVLHKCGHERRPVTGAKCFLSMVRDGNPKHYVVATQDRDLQGKLRDVPGIPLVYLHTKTPVLDPPSKASVESAHGRTSNLLNPEKEKIEQLRKASGIEDAEEKKPRRKKIKGPNPLSCKKKKPGAVRNNPIKKVSDDDVCREKKIRKKVRVPKHVKESLLASVNS